MAQETAVEWLIEQCPRIETIVAHNILEQAKAMEKQQRIADYNVGYQDAQCNHINDAENYASEREYMNHNTGAEQ